MTISVLRDETYRFRWIHCEQPTPEELDELAAQFGLHATSVRACLEPEHHPKIEFFESSFFIILRFYDAQSSTDATTVRELTRKLAIFATSDFVLTVSRTSQKAVNDLRARWTLKSNNPKSDTIAHLVSDFMRAAATSFEPPLLMLQQHLELLESQTIEDRDSSLFLSEAITLRRRVSVFYRVTSQVSLVARECIHHFRNSDASYFRNTAENCERLMFATDQAEDDIEDLIQLNMSLGAQRMTQASNKTNDVMRVLTVFSVLFMPLNLIAGIYGMNFDHMPGLHHPNGMWVTLGGMAVLAVTVFFWFRQKGWLRDED